MLVDTDMYLPSTFPRFASPSQQGTWHLDEDQLVRIDFVACSRALDCGAGSATVESDMDVQQAKPDHVPVSLCVHVVVSSPAPPLQRRKSRFDREKMGEAAARVAFVEGVQAFQQPCWHVDSDTHWH
eukprot:8471890-Alexandrium_andersonii.AAC.1